MYGSINVAGGGRQKVTNGILSDFKSAGETIEPNTFVKLTTDVDSKFTSPVQYPVGVSEYTNHKPVIVKLTDTTALFVYINDDSDYYKTRCCLMKVEGENVTFGTEVDLAGTSAGVGRVHFIPLSSNKVIHLRRRTTDCIYQFITINDDETISVSSMVILSNILGTSYCFPCYAEKISDDLILTIGKESNSTIAVRYLHVAGDTITLGDMFTLVERVRSDDYTISEAEMHVAKLDDDKYIIYHHESESGDTDYYFGYLTCFTLNGTTLTKGTTYQAYYDRTSSYGHTYGYIHAIDENSALFSVTHLTNGWNMSVVKIQGIEIAEVGTEVLLNDTVRYSTDMPQYFNFEKHDGMKTRLLAFYDVEESVYDTIKLSKLRINDLSITIESTDSVAQYVASSYDVYVGGLTEISDGKLIASYDRDNNNVPTFFCFLIDLYSYNGVVERCGLGEAIYGITKSKVTGDAAGKVWIIPEEE